MDIYNNVSELTDEFSPCSFDSDSKICNYLQSSKSFPKRKQGENKFKIKASMTVEAALVLPIFLFTILSIAFLIEVVRLQIHIGCAVGQSAKEMAGYGYPYLKIKNGLIKSNDNKNNIINKDNQSLGNIELLSMPGLLFANDRIKQLAGREYLDNSIIVNGSSGINLLGSEILKDGKWINLVVSYEVKLPFSLIPNANIKIIQKATSHAWVGHIDENQADNNKEQIVFMTRHGTRYHTNVNCRHLNIKPKMVGADNIENLRNKSGGKYYPCSRCIGDSAGHYYITEYGNSYHTDRACSAISRNIIEKKLSEVEGIPCCKDCMK